MIANSDKVANSFSPKGLSHGDIDDGMKAELRDLAVSEQLLRRELALVHEQAELRRERRVLS